MSSEIKVEVIYALPDRAIRLVLNVPENSTIEQVIALSKINEKIDNLDLAQCKVGIFGKLCKLDSLVREADRIEIYRPLIADPKEIRRQRAAAGKEMKKNAGDAN